MHFIFKSVQKYIVNLLLENLENTELSMQPDPD